MYQPVGSVTDWIDAATKVAGSVSTAVKNVKAKKSGGAGFPDETLPEILVTPPRVNPWLIGGAIGVAALVLWASRK